MNFAQVLRLVLLILVFDSMCLILLDRKYSLTKTLIIFGGFTAASIGINASIWILFGWRMFTICYAPITNGCSTLGLFFLSKRKGFPVIFTMLTATVLANVSATVATYVRLETGWSIWPEILIRLIIGIPTIILIYRYLRPSYLQMFAVMKKGWGYLCLIPGLYYMIAIINSIDLPLVPSEYRRIFLNFFLSLFITAASYGVVFALFGRIIRETQMRDEQQLLKIQMQTMERHADMLRENEEKVQIYRRELSQYIADVKSLLESGNKKEALRLLGSLDEQNTSTSIPYYCNNPTVNAILMYYIQKARNKGITVDADCRLPERLPMEASELAMVLANAIENAIHACEKLPEDRERLIKIKMVSSPQLALEVVNSYTGKVAFDENGLPISTEIGHGLGTKSISAFVEKHDGIIEYDADDTLFRLRMLVGA